MERIPLVDLRAQYRALAGDLERAVREVLESGVYVGGPQVKGFEEEFAEYAGAPHCVGLSSGSDALRLALRACGVGPGQEVILPAFTFIATAEAVTQVGAVPVFADIDPRSFCLLPEDLLRRIGRKTGAIIPVHLFGRPADMDPILEIAASRGIRIIQDACQAHGALYKGRRLGEMGDAACFSFYPSKNLGACGEGGAVVTRSEEVARRLRILRDHGQRERYVHETEGCNARLHALQAAILRVKLRKLEGWIRLRREAASRYGKLLRGIPVTLPEESPDGRHVYYLYVIRTPERGRVSRVLGEEGIATALHYPAPLHLLKPYSPLGHGEGDLPHSEEASRTVLSLPLYPEITPESQERVARCIEKSLHGKRP